MEDDLPRLSGDAAAGLSYESLDRYSQAELIQRIALLETEIARVKAHHARAADQRKLADSLFGSGSAPSGEPGSAHGDGG